MKYKTRFDYTAEVNGKITLQRKQVSVGIFQVEGGANRFITINSSDDVSLVSEMEQATTHKNITLYLPPTKDGSDMQVAVELTDIALDNTLSLTVYFGVEKHSGVKMIEAFILKGQVATINRPYIVTVGGSPMLKVELSFLNARWRHGKLNNKNKMIMEDM